jgi:hypothetical protein
MPDVLGVTGLPSLADVCPRCGGHGELSVNPGYPDPQQADWVECPLCLGLEPSVEPLARRGVTT